MHSTLLCYLLAFAAVTTRLSYAPRASNPTTSLVVLLAFPSFAPAAPLLVDDILASNSTSESPGTYEEHHHKHNGTTESESAHGSNVTDPEEGQHSHNGTLLAGEGAGNETEHHKHNHHNCTDTATGAQPSTTNAVLNVGNDEEGTSSSSGHAHHHHECSKTSGSAVATQTVQPLPLTSSSA